MKNKILPALLLYSLYISACAPAAAPAVEVTAKPVGSAEDTPRTLTICLGTEPESLYPYAVSSQAAKDVLQAIYDGPIDEVDGQAVPVILSALPDAAAGSAGYTPVSVVIGDLVVDIYGELVTLQAGTQVFPSGCTNASCALTWDGTSELLMDQPTATFQLKSGLTWSDGQPLSAADSVYSFNLAADPATPNDKTGVNRTVTYTALDDTTLQWTGKPGLVTDTYEDYFWMPLPQHTWGDASAAELLDSEQAIRSPLGWGPYMLDEWKAGEYIRLVKNPLYFRADEGLPKFDVLIFKLTNTHGDTNLANLKFDHTPFAQFDFDVGDFEGEVAQSGCDITSSTADMSDQLDVLHILMHYFSNPAVKTTEGLGKGAEWLLFNQRESDAIFTDVRMRQAVANCLNRVDLVETVFYDLVHAPDSFSFSYQQEPSGNPDFEFNLSKGQDLLAEIGWVAENPRDDQPRVASGVTGIPDGTILSLNYLTLDDTLSLATANHVKSDLVECGLQVNIIAVPPETYWDPSAKESIFQGNYHLAQLAWSLPVEDPCPLFASQNIPQEENNFSGLNFSGFSNAQVEELCSQLETTNLNAARQKLLDQIQEILNEELVILPLYTKADLLVTRSDFCPAPTGADSRSELAGIESFDYGENCTP